MNHPPTFDLDRLHAGELTGWQADEIRSHLEACSACCDCLSRLQAEQDRLLGRTSVEQFADGLLDHPSADAHPRPIMRWGLLASAAAVALVLLVVVVVLVAEHPSRTDDLRWMGEEAAVEVFVNRAGRTAPFADQVLQPGDRLRFRLSLPDDREAFVVLVAVQQPRASVVLPAGDDQQAIAVRGETFIPGSVVIEPGDEPVDLVLVVRSRAFRPLDVTDEMSRTGSHPHAVFQMRIPPVKP